MLKVNPRTKKQTARSIDPIISEPFLPQYLNESMDPIAPIMAVRLRKIGKIFYKVGIVSNINYPEYAIITP